MLTISDMSSTGRQLAGLDETLGPGGVNNENTGFE